MLSLPRTTHRYFIEPLSETKHNKSIKARFLSFVEKIRSSKKEVLRTILRTIENDCRSTTGRNLRKLKLETKQGKINDQPYAEIDVNDAWKIPLARDIVDIKSDKLTINDMSTKELEAIEYLVCSS